MQDKHLLCLMLGLAIDTFGSSSVLAQPKPSLQRLPDGNHFFGEVRSPNQAGKHYLVFRKTGLNVTGLYYLYRTDEGYCFKGRANGDTITDMTIEEIEPGVGTRFKRGISINFSGFNQLKFSQLPETKAAFQRCIGLRYN